MFPSPRVLLLAARPKTLWAGVAPVLLGTAMAWEAGVFHGLSAALALLGAIFIQVATNYYNDYADFEKGADTEDRKGPVRATASGMATVAQMRMATILAFGLAVAAGTYLMLRGGLPIVVIGFSAIAFGVLYTGGRYSLAYLGIADLFVLAYFGPVAVGGTYFVQALEITPQVLMAGVAPGAWSVAILMVNNIRDVEQDRAANKRTPVVRLGRSNGVGLYAAAMGVALLTPALLVQWTGGHWVALASLLLAVPAFRLFRVAADPADEDRLNEVLGRTARLLLVHTLVFAIGWVFPL